MVTIKVEFYFSLLLMLVVIVMLVVMVDSTGIATKSHVPQRTGQLSPSHMYEAVT